jgi:hypothetical protein
MDTNLSLAAILSSLEAQIAHHREQEALHAGREAFHRDRRTEHAAELEQLVRHLEGFTASAASAAELAARLVPAPPAPPPFRPADELPPGTRISINLAVAKVIEGREAEEPFGPLDIAEEVSRHFAGRMKGVKGGIDLRQASVALRWLADNGRIFRLSRGRPHQESKYVRQLPRK